MIDNIFGNLEPGEIGIFLAEAGLGKSVFSTYAATSFAASGKNVLVVSVNDDPVMGARLASAITACVEPTEAAEVMNRIRVASVDPGSSVSSIAEMIKTMPRPDVLVVDGLDLIAFEPRQPYVKNVLSVAKCFKDLMEGSIIGYATMASRRSESKAFDQMMALDETSFDAVWVVTEREEDRDITGARKLTTFKHPRMPEGTTSVDICFKTWSFAQRVGAS